MKILIGRIMDVYGERKNLSNCSIKILTFPIFLELKLIIYSTNFGRPWNIDIFNEKSPVNYS